ncbi:retrovirus-related pol polyprotein from transposon TNT 1-94 [Tanacetum coccineum]
MLAPSGGGLILYQAYGRKAYLLEDKQIPSVEIFDEVFSIWMAFGGNTRDLGSFGKETDKTTTLHQILEEVVHIECGDGVANSLNGIVRNIHTNNGSEFVNQSLRDYYEQVEISHETLVARTPQQNGVVERDDWDCLFQPMFDEYFNPSTIVVSLVPIADAPRAVNLADSHVSTSVDQDRSINKYRVTQEKEHFKFSQGV